MASQARNKLMERGEKLEVGFLEEFYSFLSSPAKILGN